MLTPQDVRAVQFEKNLRGYRTEDVDRFLDKSPTASAAAQVWTMAARGTMQGS